jgi:RNA-directed DNA polymerase
LLAVRKVTQDNSGKRTAGVDRIKSLTPKQRFEMVKTLKLGGKSKPIRRIWIPKPGKDEKRPLGIPVMRDRVVQTLAKAALEPEWEAKFEENSYGFRPGRSAHDAIEAIFKKISFKAKYVLDADIAKCFDRINHEKLLNKINTYPKLRRQLKSWLKADICDFAKHERTPNQEGTPQGGVISPLLSNIALHGMERLIQKIPGAHLVRYADDFVVLHEFYVNLRQCQHIITEWLAQYDLKINEEKTKIVHTLRKCGGNEPGFDFLGFNIKQYKVGKYKSGRCNKKVLGFKTIVTPSKDKVKLHYQKIAETCEKYKNAKQEILINKLTPIIKGWSNYYKTVVSCDTFDKLSHLTFLRLAKWGYRRHPGKSKTWVNRKYWRKIGNDKWVFSANENNYLCKHQKVAIKRHIKVKQNKFPYDGDTIYWSSRMGKHPELKTSTAKLLKKQKGKCNVCGLTFQDGDVIEPDHIKPQAIGGTRKDNLQLLHKHCHDIKTRKDLVTIKRHKSQKDWDKTLKQFNKENWIWVDDIPTLVRYS